MAPLAEVSPAARRNPKAATAKIRICVVRLCLPLFRSKLKELSKARDYRVSGAARDAVSHIRGVPTLSQQLGAYR